MVKWGEKTQWKAVRTNFIQINANIVITFLAFWLATYINDVDAAQKCNFSFLQSFLDYSKLCDDSAVRPLKEKNENLSTNAYVLST